MRIDEVAADYRLEDVWALNTPGGPDDFPLLVEMFMHGNLVQTAPPVVRALFAIRWKLGALFGWDEPGSSTESLPFTPLYETDDEYAAEAVNKTMHGILHLAWVPDEAGGYRGQLAVYVQPNGLLGEAYMLAIRPFRHLIVYPALLRQIERTWRARVRSG